MSKNCQRTVQIFYHTHTFTYTQICNLLYYQRFLEFISQIKEGNNIYWDFSPKKYYDIKEVKIYTINVIVKDIKMKFDILTSKIFLKIEKTTDRHFVFHSV